MKLKTNVITIATSVLLAAGSQLIAQTPKDQIALQLGAIQMGYTVPFAISANSTATQRQQAVNALVMGRNAMNATVSMPAATVKGVIKSPSVNSVDYRDQLYSAVEYVVTSPVNATINGTVVLSNNSTLTVNNTTLTTASASNDWMTPVPYALESRSSVDTQVLRAELVAAGVLKNTPTTTAVAPSFIFYAPSTPTGAMSNGIYDFIVCSSMGGLSFRYGNTTTSCESFQSMIERRLANSDRITVFNTNLLAPNNSGIQLALSWKQKQGHSSRSIQAILAHPVAQGTVTEIKSSNNSSSTTEPVGGFTSDNTVGNYNKQTLIYNGVQYKLYQLWADMSPTSPIIHTSISRVTTNQ